MNARPLLDADIAAMMEAVEGMLRRPASPGSAQLLRCRREGLKLVRMMRLCEARKPVVDLARYRAASGAVGMIA